MICIWPFGLVAIQQTIDLKLYQCDSNPVPHSSEPCVLTTTRLTKHTPPKWARHQAKSVSLWFIPWKSTSHLLFWYPITLGLQPPKPTTFEVGGPMNGLLVITLTCDSTTGSYHSKILTFVFSYSFYDRGRCLKNFLTWLTCQRFLYDLLAGLLYSKP